MDVNTAIRNGDADALRKLLAEKPSRANELIHWGKCRTHPLHYVSDMLFEGALQKGKELPLIDALIRACGPQLRARREARNAAYRSRESRSRGCRAQAPGCWSETGSAWSGVGGESDILEVVRARIAEEEGGDEGGVEAGGSEERDPLFRQAAECCIQNQLGSTSLLQRRLKIGYGRAARIIDQLHDAGILGPPDGSKARQVLVGMEDLEGF